MEKEPIFSVNWEEEKKIQREKKTAEDAASLREYLEYDKGEERRREREEKKQETENLADTMTSAIMIESVKRKLKRGDAAHLLLGLEGDILSPVISAGRGELANDERWQTAHKEIMKGVREAITDHYDTVYFPGGIHYVKERDVPGKENEAYELGKPLGLGYEIQRMMLEKGKFKINDNNVKFFEPGKEDEVPAADLQNALMVYVNNRERETYEQKYARKVSFGTTWILFESLWKGGFFDHLKPKEKMEMMALAMFADILEKGEWLDFVSSGFFDDREINLFKINRKLSKDQLAKIFNDFLTGDTKVASYDFQTMSVKIQEIIVRASTQPLDQAFIKKHNLDTLVNNHMYESRKAEKYLLSGRNSCDSQFGEIIFTTGFKERLPGQLPAIAADPVKDQQTRKPLWRRKNGYFEVNKAHLLGYLHTADFQKFLGKITREAHDKGLNPQVSEINGWTKIFIPFNGTFDAKLADKLQRDWLKIEKKVPSPKEKKEKVLVERWG